MKRIINNITAFLALVVVFTACTKVEDLPAYSTGSTPTLAASKTAVTTAPADSNNVAITFSWSNPNFATDSANYKYVVEIDSAGRNFTKAWSRTITKSLSTSFTGKEFNNVLLGFGFAFNVSYPVEVRVIASYLNNNDRKISNVLRINATPYKVPPKIALPTSNRLFIVGGGTAFGWTNAMAINPAEEFVRLNETTWAGVFNLTAGGEYLVLPVKGDWSNKFAIGNKFLAGVSGGGDFGFNLNDNFVCPAATGMYLITFDFQVGRFTCVPFTGPQLPTNLFLVGGATPAGWSNPASGPTVQPFTRTTSSTWEITIALTPDEYLVLPVAGSWSNKYSVANKTLAGLAAGGDFGYNLNDNFPAPTPAGNYKIEMNFATGKFKTTRQ